jgi:hypothetical protein
MYGPSDVLSPSLPYRNATDSRSRAMFPDPFLDMASMIMPESLKQILDLCEGVWLRNGTYRMAASRIVRYFITKVEFKGASEANRQTFKSFLEDRLRVTEQLALLGDDFLAYGNSMSSIILPFRRYLKCEVCGAEQSIETSEWSFNSFKFSARCRVCRKTTAHTHIDRKSTEEDKICVKRWSPRQIRIRQHPISNYTEYFWEIPADVAEDIKSGNKFIIKYMPWEIIETVKNSQLFRFNPGVLYHIREQTLSGVETRGWGMSRLLSNFAQAWYIQILKRYNEALALDFVVPFRVLTPAPSQREADPLLHGNAATFTQHVLRMLRQHRQDPAGWNVMPFPMNYQALGGEAKSLATPELINQGIDEMLNAIGIPAELYRGTLQLQAMPTALRLFQQTWPQLTAAMNGWLGWAAEIVCTAQNWDKPETVSLQPVTLADDIEQRHLRLQLASSNLISKRTAFAPLDLDAMAEQERVFEEQKVFADMNQRFQEDMAQQQQNQNYLRQPPFMPGQPPAAPGGPMPAGAGVNPQQASGSMTPMDMQAQADQLAQTLLTMPYEARRSELGNLKNSNETLHALVKGKMEDYRNNAASVGKQLVLQGGV